MADSTKRDPPLSFSYNVLRNTATHKNLTKFFLKIITWRHNYLVEQFSFSNTETSWQEAYQLEVKLRTNPKIHLLVDILRLKIPNFEFHLWSVDRPVRHASFIKVYLLVLYATLISCKFCVLTQFPVSISLTGDLFV